MPGFYKHTDSGIEWQSFAYVKAKSIEMTFAESDYLISVTIPKVKGDVLAEGCKLVQIEFSQYSLISGGKYIQVRAYGASGANDKLKENVLERKYSHFCIHQRTAI